MLQRLTRHDERLLGAFAGLDAPAWLDRGFRLLTHAGGATASAAACLLLLAIPATRRIGLVATLANVGSHLVVQALKRSVVRPRPSGRQPHLAPRIHLPDEFSFPSGHACAAMAVSTAILLASPLAGGPALLVALLVGASRVYLRVHYPTDVVVGQLLGAGSALGIHWSLA
jgi:undecaprenyl-diphosphatase